MKEDTVRTRYEREHHLAILITIHGEDFDLSLTVWLNHGRARRARRGRDGGTPAAGRVKIAAISRPCLVAMRYSEITSPMLVHNDRNIQAD